MGAVIEVKYFNSFWMKQIQGLVTNPAENNPKWPSLEWNPFGYPEFPLNAVNDADNWYIEEARIKGGYNNTIVSQGVRAYLNEKNPQQDIREASLIYSGVYNNRTEINRTNVFSIGEVIEADLDPMDGSIQKLFAEDTNLTIFQENKVTKALVNKNAIYSGTQGSKETPEIPVIGQIVPYLGVFGIGKNPESFAQYGFRKYFVDPIRGSVMRLSRDGLTEISNYGMKDYFRDALNGTISERQEASIPWTKVSPTIPSLVENVTWTGANTGGIYASLEGGQTSGSVYTFITTGTTAVLNLAYNPQGGGGSGSGGKIQVTINNPSVPQLGGAQAVVTDGGSGYAVGDQLIVVGDGIHFSGNIEITLNTSQISSTVNSFYISDENKCVVFAGSKVFNADSNGLKINTGATVSQVVKINDPTLGDILEVFTNITVTPTDTGFFSYDFKSKIIGGWDNYNRYYIVSIQSNPSYLVTTRNFDTLSYDESIRGWVSFYSYKPGHMVSLKGLFFSTQSIGFYQHNLGRYTQYYGVAVSPYVRMLINANPSVKKTFQTINYEGDNGWQVSGIRSDATKFSTAGTARVDIGNRILSYEEGIYTGYDGFPQRAGFDRKENLYTANLNNSSLFNAEEVISGNVLTGLKGYLLEATFTTDLTTDLYGPKEIWSVGTTYVQSS